jgi:hypothetical protein
MIDRENFRDRRPAMPPASGWIGRRRLNRGRPFGAALRPSDDTYDDVATLSVVVIELD